MKPTPCFFPEFLQAAARRDISRRRLELSEQLGLSDYPERAQDLAALTADSPSLRKLDRRALAA